MLATVDGARAAGARRRGPPAVRSAPRSRARRRPGRVFPQGTVTSPPSSRHSALRGAEGGAATAEVERSRRNQAADKTGERGGEPWSGGGPALRDLRRTHAPSGHRERNRHLRRPTVDRRRRRSRTSWLQRLQVLDDRRALGVGEHRVELVAVVALREHAGVEVLAVLHLLVREDGREEDVPREQDVRCRDPSGSAAPAGPGTSSSGSQLTYGDANGLSSDAVLAGDRVVPPAELRGVVGAREVGVVAHDHATVWSARGGLRTCAARCGFRSAGFSTSHTFGTDAVVEVRRGRPDAVERRREIAELAVAAQRGAVLRAAVLFGVPAVCG